MALKILNPNQPANPFAAKAKKQAREKLDFTSELERVGWKGVQLMAQDMFGKTKGFTLGECKKMMERIKRGV